MSELPSSVPSPEPHPMDPHRGRGLSPAFAALLCWALDLPAMTEPAIVDVAVTGNCVFVATADDPFFNRLLGSWQDCRDNLLGWGAACSAPSETVHALIDRVRCGGSQPPMDSANAPGLPARHPHAP